MQKKIGNFKLVDTHAHLTFKDYNKDIKQVLDRAWTEGLESIVVIGSGEGVKSIKAAVAFANSHDNVYSTVGVHPHDAENVDLDEALELCRGLLSEKKVVAVGEIGLDFFKEYSCKEAQIKCFTKFMQLSFENKIPVCIHDRDAHAELLSILREYKYDLSGGVIHCYSGDLEMAKELVNLGFYIGIPGVVTFKNATMLKEVVKEIPVEKLVLETDCPFLTPEPYRGKRNEPSYVKYIAAEISKIKKLSIEDVGRITSINASRAYNLPNMLPVGQIAYSIRNSLYINLTNKCTLSCKFCPKQSGSFEVKGHNLKLSQEPNVEDVFRAVGTLDKYDEVVFCGYGEPTLRIEVLKIVAKQMKKNGVKVRIDTDGLMNLVHERDVLPELAGLVDAISVSMNASDPKTYSNLCPSKYGDQAFYAMLSLLGRAKEFIPEVTASVVSVPGLDIAACEKLAKEIGVTFRLRKYQDLG